MQNQRHSDFGGCRIKTRNLSRGFSTGLPQEPTAQPLRPPRPVTVLGAQGLWHCRRPLPPGGLDWRPGTEELGAIPSAPHPPRGWLCTALMTTSRLRTLVLWSSVILHINRNSMAWSQGPRLGHEKPEPCQQGAIFYGFIVKFLNPGTIRN